ncbi:MAG: protein-glutamate methylesterase/protein-glutamine glutaminase, partial [Isosphaeraceae bacterium]
RAPDVSREARPDLANLSSERENPAAERRSGDGRRVRVLVVDDSALMRRLLSDLLSSAPEIEVVGFARDGREAIAEAARLKPDVVTMDVEMPEVSGLEALPTLLAVHEVSVLMVSALTQEGAEVTLQALELGAVDYLPKPRKNPLGEMRAARDVLIAKVLAAAQSRVRRPRRAARSRPVDAGTSAAPAAGSPSASPGRPRRGPGAPASEIAPVGVIVIGISTGGPQALSQVLPMLAAPIPPVLIVQHMLAEFTGVFAQRLDRYTDSSIRVKLAEEGDAILPDRILIAVGGRHLAIAGKSPRARVTISDEPEVSGHRPSIDVLFRSAAAAFGPAVAAILMTGMGRDGVDGCKAVRQAGGLTLGQDEATSVVYGMNKAALIEGALAAQFPLDELPAILQDLAAYRARLGS